jgi:hypothetical protein
MIQFANFPITLVQNRPNTIGPITWLTGAPVAPVDLSGCTANFDIALDPSHTPLIQISTTPNAQGSVVLGGTTGTIVINLTAAATLLLPAGVTGGITNIFQNAARYQLDVVFPGFGAWPLALGAVGVIAPA